MNTIAIANHKGGTAKTTSTEYLAKHIAADIPTLAIDLDPQGSLTRALNVSIDHTNGIADVMMGRTSLNRAAQLVKDNPPNSEALTLIGTDIKLEETAAAIQAKSPNHIFLRNALKKCCVANLALIDCPPAANILVANALTAADGLIIPVSPDPEAIEGMQRMVAMVDWFKNNGMHAPAVIGIITTLANPNVIRGQQSITHIQSYAAESTIPILGMVPFRSGKDAEAHFANAYESIAHRVMDSLN